MCVDEHFYMAFEANLIHQYLDESRTVEVMCHCNIDTIDSRLDDLRLTRTVGSDRKPCLRTIKGVENSLARQFASRLSAASIRGK